MSILALGIGITMVATLFPTSILRSINATRLTRGTIHRYNAEAWIDVFTDQLVHNPDLSGMPLPGNPVFSPRKHYDVNNPAAQGGYSGNNYIVDPIGWELIRRDNPAAANYFGSITATFGNGRLERYNGLNNRLLPLTAAQFATARQVAESPDTWVEPLAGEFTVTATTAVAPSGGTATITGPSTGDLQALSDQLGGTEPPLMRIVLLDADAKFSHVRTVSGVTTGGVISWSTGGALPSGFTASVARIQTQERQFTWLLTVRNRTELGATVAQDKKKANVDVVVFFRRQYSTNYENSAWTFVKSGNRRYLVKSETNTQLPTVASGGKRPFLKKGAWLCDTIYARWYRIQRIESESSQDPYIVLEQDPPASETLTKGVILPTVVEVYTLGTKQ